MKHKNRYCRYFLNKNSGKLDKYTKKKFYTLRIIMNLYNKLMQYNIIIGAYL